MITRTVVITTDSNGDGTKDITEKKPFIFSNLRAFDQANPTDIEYFRLFYQILDPAGIQQDAGSDTPGGGAGTSGSFFLSPSKLITGVEVRPNQTLKIHIKHGAASSTYIVRLDLEFI